MELMLPMVTEENASLPLSINVVAKYWGVDLPLPDGVAERYPPNTGSVLADGLDLAKANGLSTCITRTDVSGLHRIMDASVPPIVLLPGLGNLTHHLSVLSGYDQDALLHYIPKSDQEGIYEGAIPGAIFNGKWSQEGRVVILVTPPDVLSGMEFQNSQSLRLCMEAERATILGLSDRAQSLLRAAIDSDESNMTAWLLLAGIQNRGGAPECVQSYERCLQLNPLCYLAHRGLGNYHLKTENLDAAEKSYTGAIGVDSERSGVVYKNRAYIREKMGMLAQAADDLVMYVKLSPAAPDRGMMERAILELRRG